MQSKLQKNCASNLKGITRKLSKLKSLYFDRSRFSQLIFYLWILGSHIDLIRDISLVHTPMKEIEENTDTILPLYNPKVLELVVFSHIKHMIFYEIIDMVTKDIHITLCQQSFISLGVHYELEKEHKQQVKWLKCPPRYLGANCSCKFEKAISNTNSSVYQWRWRNSRVEINIHLCENFNFMQMIFIQFLAGHLGEKLSNLSNYNICISLSSCSFLFSFWRESWNCLNRQILSLLDFITIPLLVSRLHRGPSTLLVLRRWFADFSRCLYKWIVTFPSCFCFICVKSAAQLRQLLPQGHLKLRGLMEMAKSYQQPSSFSINNKLQKNSFQ